MDRHTFFTLCSMLRTIGRLDDSEYVPLEKQVAFFLNILVHHIKNRIVHDAFKRSTWTISEYFHKVLKGVIRLQSVLLKKPEPIEENSREEQWKWFKNHPRANDWRGKPCPYYEDLCIIFGKDHASGKDAQGPEGMEDEVNEEGENEESSKKDEPESSSTQEPSGVEASSVKSGNLGKQVRASDNLVKGLSEVASILRREIRPASSNISRAIDFDVELSKKRSKLNEELANLGLTTIERHQAARKIAYELESIDVVFSILDAERKELVQALP
ncbi:hypothetical protein Cgig2_017183 [Carnegiea gigantea]|uniref:DUF8040 domain-containing protein n=1 Tax=Carnegiea gigantea TaxID=171969 RepID=A0A9Q1QBG5_9CARY|nr:hypothetical protein Cgig2_017183 [Carnegiea gigantea]